MNITKTGIEKIQAERLEHFFKHNITVIDDVEKNPNGELVEAALYLLTSDPLHFPCNWSPATRLKLDRKSDQEKKIIAATLLAAEYDRVNYLETENK